MKCPECLKTVDYSQILEKFRSESYGEIFIFQQDTCPIYKANSVRSYLRQNRIEVLKEPTYSPDLNFMENLGAIVNRQLPKGTLIWDH